MTIENIIHEIEEFAPLSLQESYDNAGLLCGDSNCDVKSALLTIDVTEDVIDEAISLGCKLIISHHPLSLSGFKKINPDTWTSRCLIKAIKNDIALYAAHTNMDSVINGVSGRMAKKLGLKNTKLIESTNDKTGFGMYGTIAPIDAQSFLNSIKDTFKCSHIRHSAICKKNIKTVAVCGGSGSFLIENVKALNCDIFITGDIKYHDFFRAENKIILADIGHYESEQFTKEIFYEILTKKFPNFALCFSEVNTNPILYL